MRGILFGLFLALSSSAAQAEWMEASSTHFVVYADDTEKNLRAFGERLERYHAALSVVTGVHLADPSPSNRVTVYVVDDLDAVKTLHGGDNDEVAGFYSAGAGGSLAIVPKVRAGDKQLAFSMTVLLHEYTHHFMHSASSFPMPVWYSEGSAEYFSSAEFTADGGVVVGRPATHRAAGLIWGRDVTAAQMLDPAEQAKRRWKQDYAFYGRAWLLRHYLQNAPERKGQLQRYFDNLASGQGGREAAESAFGDFSKLDWDLDGYLERKKMLTLQLSGAAVAIKPVTIRALRPGEAAIMPQHIRSKVGVDATLARQVAEQARAVAARFPADPAVLSELAEAEFDAGNDEAAIAAADAALSADPATVNAYVQKGYALYRMAAKGKDKDGYQKGRKVFVALNRLENDHPLPLLHFYLAYARQGLPVPPIALQGLERAVDVAPFDRSIRMTLALQQLRSGAPDKARRNLGLIAIDPHAGKLAETARTMVERLDREPAWDGRDAVLPNEGETD